MSVKQTLALSALALMGGFTASAPSQAQVLTSPGEYAVDGWSAYYFNTLKPMMMKMNGAQRKKVADMETALSKMEMDHRMSVGKMDMEHRASVLKMRSELERAIMEIFAKEGPA